jgi:hypothetical protein
VIFLVQTKGIFRILAVLLLVVEPANPAIPQTAFMLLSRVSPLREPWQITDFDCGRVPWGHSCWSSPDKFGQQSPVLI